MKSVVDILLSVEVPVLPYYNLLFTVSLVLRKAHFITRKTIVYQLHVTS